MVAATEEMTVLGPWAESLKQDMEDARLLGPDAEERTRFIIEKEYQIGEISRPERHNILSVLNS